MSTAVRGSGSPMRKVSLRNLAAHKVRLALTVLSVVLGTAFVAGSFVFTDTLQHTFDGIFGDAAKGVDVRVSPKEERSVGIPNADMQKLATTEGVRLTAPGVFGFISLMNSEGKTMQTGGAPTMGLLYLPPERAIEKSQTFIDGSPPVRDGEVALNSQAAKKGKLKVGDKTSVRSPAFGKIPVTVTGIYEIPTDSGGFIGVMFSEQQALKLFTDGEHVAYVDIAAQPGVNADQLRDKIKAAYPNYKVQNADQVRKEAKDQIGVALSFINYFLIAFGAIALLVGTFIIYNTFSMIVAQRLRELALLRAIGASRGQVGRSVVLEALVVGLIGSVLGLLGGVGLAYGLSALLDAFGIGLPTGTLQVTPRTVAVALFVGVVVTLISAYAPARRAAKVPPVEAMREEFASVGDSLRIRTIIGALLGLAGVALILLGAQDTGATAASLVGLGALALILAVLFAGPWLSRPIVAALGVVFTKPFGPVGRLARNNAARNPRRTAATAFALTLGLMLVSAIGTFGASAKESVNSAVDTGIRADYLLVGPQGMVSIPLDVRDKVRAVSGVKDTVSVRAVALKNDGEELTGSAALGDISAVMAFTMVSGSPALSGNAIIVSKSEAARYSWRQDQTVELTTFDNKPLAVRIGGIYEDMPMMGKWILSGDLYDRLVPVNMRSDLFVMVKATSGTDLSALRTDLEKVVNTYDDVQVQDREEFKSEAAKQIDVLLAILYALLALAIVIAILGIINTLALSVVERKREIGMLRAVGTSRAQVRRTIYLESLLIAVFGAVVGVVLGLGLGVGFMRTVRDQGLDTIAVPWGQVVFMLIAAAVVGVLAALWPAIRAARTRPLEAIADL